MKFADIPKFIQDGNYQINVPISDLEKQLESYKQNYNLELNPDFQRGHVWTEKQQIAWLEFFFKGGKTSRVIYFNCGDFIDAKQPDCDIPNMVCVDGLQRLTALLRFIRNEIPIFGTYWNEFEDRPRMSCDILFNVNSLQYRKDVLSWYIQMNEGGTPHSQEEIERVKKLLEES